MFGELKYVQIKPLQCIQQYAKPESVPDDKKRINTRGVSHSTLFFACTVAIVSGRKAVTQLLFHT